MINVSKCLNSIGKASFIEHFELYKRGIYESEKSNDNSGHIRQKFANRIFINRLDTEALRICATANISSEYKRKAEKLLRNYEIDDLPGINYSGYSLDKLLAIIHDVTVELRNRNIIRSKNILGDLCEYYVQQYFKEKDFLPKLDLVTLSNKNYDLIDSLTGKRYQVKGITQSETSNFAHHHPDENAFDFLIIVKLDKKYQITDMFMIDWNEFQQLKKVSKSKTVIKVNNYFKSKARRLL
ncbi:hypothetical protein [Paracholeplasma manati]|uniref:hypothetical protein n=1 Tax=Paracholeplasma manati TaxID=591373 RepID=UPI002407F5FE|nr:hypothetical protein [Paracholeplasma manati]MDG0889244.1 hypothetical protein [Paracholeplasma manati]